MKIYLENLKIFAYHGLYDTEKENGQMFEIQCIIDFLLDPNFSDSIEHTIDYVAIYNIINSQMAIRSSLLEDVIKRIHNSILCYDSKIQSCQIRIAKLTPPIPGMIGTVAVEMN